MWQYVEEEPKNVPEQKASPIEKTSEVKNQEVKVPATQPTLHTEKNKKEAAPTPKEDESAYWTAVFDKNSGYYYYWNRVSKAEACLFIEN